MPNSSKKHWNREQSKKRHSTPLRDDSSHSFTDQEPQDQKQDSQITSTTITITTGLTLFPPHHSKGATKLRSADISDKGFSSHPFHSEGQTDESLRWRRSARNAEDNSQEDLLPLFLGGDNSSPDASKSNTLNNMELTSVSGSVTVELENTSLKQPGIDKVLDESPGELPKTSDQDSVNALSRVFHMDCADMGLMALRGRDYESNSSAKTLKPSPELQSPRRESVKVGTPPPATDAPTSNDSSLESDCSAPGTSQGSMSVGDALELPSTDIITKIKPLQLYASAIRELVCKSIEGGRQLEALSMQLIVLAIWKKIMDICHAQATGQEITTIQIEREFLQEVEHAEEVYKGIESGTIVMPDAMETIFRSACDLGQHGVAEELLHNNENAALLYSKAASLLKFLLVEAPSLAVNPPLILTDSIQHTLQTYIDAINSRHSLLSVRMASFEREGQQCPK